MVLHPSPPDTTRLAYDDFGGDGRLVVLLPGAGDVRSEHRFLGAHLRHAGYRVVSADLPGHGQSPVADRYGVEETSSALVDLVSTLQAGSAAVIAVSFAPAAAVWAASDRPDLIAGVVAISPHMASDTSIKGRIMAASIRLLMRGPWAAPVWERLYRSWYKLGTPPDLDGEIAKIRKMLSDPQRRRAARQTLLAHRHGVEERMGRLPVPAMVVFGTADDHFDDPAHEATRLAGQLSAEKVLVDGAGHYPHVESPQIVGDAVASFLARLG